LMFKALFIGYLFGIRSERQLGIRPRTAVLLVFPTCS
jgi:hypothetical protein